MILGAMTLAGLVIGVLIGFSLSDWEREAREKQEQENMLRRLRTGYHSSACCEMPEHGPGGHGHTPMTDDERLRAES